MVNFYLPNPTWNLHHTEKLIPCSLFSINTFTAGVIWIDAQISFIHFNHCQTEISIQIGHHTSMAIPYYKYNIFLPYSFIVWIPIYAKMAFVVKDTTVCNIYGNSISVFLSFFTNWHGNYSHWWYYWCYGMIYWSNFWRLHRSKLSYLSIFCDHINRFLIV